MSAFSPLNLVKETSKKDQEEDLTREIEIENAFKDFEEAITLQRSKEYTRAYVKYRDLAKRDVINNHYYEEVDFLKGLQNGRLNTQPDGLSFLSQNEKTIRFLYFRNRGFLYFNILKRGGEVVNATHEEDTKSNEPGLTPVSTFEFIKSLFYSMLDDFVNCFAYQEPDESLLELLFDIYLYLDLKKLTRYALEYAKSSQDESDDPNSIIPISEKLVSIWDAFSGNVFNIQKSHDLSSANLSFLDDIKTDFQVQMMKKLDKIKASVVVKAGSNWSDFIQSFNSTVKQHQDKLKLAEHSKVSLKYLDPYLTTEYPLEEVKFSFSDFEEERPGDIPASTEPEVVDNKVGQEKLPEEIPEPNVTGEVKGDDTLPPGQLLSAEKSIQRSSRRLNPGDLLHIIPDNILLTRGYFVETEAFFTALNQQFSRIYATDSPILCDVVDYIVDNPKDSQIPLYIRDFVFLLNDWKKKTYNPILLLEKSSARSKGSNAESDKLRLLEVLTRFGNQNAAEESEVIQGIDDHEDYSFIEKYCNGINSNSLHFIRAKLEILRHFFSDAGGNLIISTKWPHELCLQLKEWVMQQELDLLKSWSAPFGDMSNGDANLSFAVSIIEMLIESYIETKAQVEKGHDSGTRVKSHKSNLNNLSIELVRLNDRIICWRDLIQSKFSPDNEKGIISDLRLRSMARFGWVSSYFIACNAFTWKEKKYAVIQLKELDDFLKGFGDRYPKINFPNYHHIGDLSRETMTRRLNTSSILSIFSKILYNNDSKNDEDAETIQLLELILIEESSQMNFQELPERHGSSLVDSVVHGRATLDGESLKSVRDFLADCPIDLKLSLWNILFLYYKGKKLYSGFQQGFEQTLEFVLRFWDSEKYKDHKVERVSLLLNSLSFYGNYCSAFLKYLSDNKWKLPIPDSKGKLKVTNNLCRIFELCYSFSLHEEASLITGNRISLSTVSEEVFCRFKDFCVESICLILIYSVNSLETAILESKDEIIKDLLILVHNQFGLRRLCDASNGLFLRFAEDTLVKLANRPDQELAQLLSCRFHYKVKIQDRFPVDHYTEESGKLDKSSAEELAAFILPLCFRHSPLLRAPRNDTKQVIDDLFEVIGDVDIDSDIGLVENNRLLEKYLDFTEIDSRFVKESFYGLLNLGIMRPQTEGKLVHGGIYYLEAILMFNSYKIRKKSAQSRTVELERIIRLLKDDLVFGTGRVESWIILGQAYGYIVEDDLIWTSDKLNTIERKAQTANLQRKALLCYMMAVNIIAQQPDFGKGENKPIVSVLMNSFVKELYSASRSPMDMIALKAYVSPKFVRRRSQAMFLALSDKPNVPLKFCLKLMLRCIILALKSNSEDWSSYYYLAKIKDKLKHDPTQVLEALVKASIYSKEQSTTSDPTLEATYKLCDLIYKYVKTDKISADLAVEFINKDPCLQMNACDSSWTKDNVYKLIVEALKKVISLDKKGWYHKPHYRIAYILDEDLNDFKKSIDVMSKFFFLKASNKSFLQMWKPEHERPGKHFVYMYQYTQFYISLLKKNKDLSSLIQMLPKLRRANSTMILLYFAWEKVCASICDLVRSALDIRSTYVERFMVQTSHPVFINKAKALCDRLKSEGIPENIKGLVLLLSVINDMKKLNNGFGPTSQVDDTLCAIYVSIYSSIDIGENTTPTADSPSAKTKRMAKKDFFPFITELVSKSKREVDAFMKDDSEILNELIVKFSEESQKRIEHEKKLLEEAQLARKAQLIQEAEIARKAQLIQEAEIARKEAAQKAQLARQAQLIQEARAARDKLSDDVLQVQIAETNKLPTQTLIVEESTPKTTSSIPWVPKSSNLLDEIQSPDVHQSRRQNESVTPLPESVISEKNDVNCYSPITELRVDQRNPPKESAIQHEQHLGIDGNATVTSEPLHHTTGFEVGKLQSHSSPNQLNQTKLDKFLKKAVEPILVPTTSLTLDSEGVEIVDDSSDPIHFTGGVDNDGDSNDGVFNNLKTEELENAKNESESNRKLQLASAEVKAEPKNEMVERNAKEISLMDEVLIISEVFLVDPPLDAKNSGDKLNTAPVKEENQSKHADDPDPVWPTGATVLGTESLIERTLKRRRGRSATLEENAKKAKAI